MPRAGPTGTAATTAPCAPRRSALGQTRFGFFTSLGFSEFSELGATCYALCTNAMWKLCVMYNKIFIAMPLFEI
jgi:hypothetical protein